MYKYQFPLTLKQMRHIFYLLGLLSKKYGKTKEELKEELKKEYCKLTKREIFSFSPYEYNSLSWKEANIFIEFLRLKLYGGLNGGKK
ncbi:hypothetical protein [Fusobacterium perfoetens]|uniref:hypothetical protein n=1 Tax=Fusobacterium perfoetens TaxID=852 RepID=UPI000486006C|nr:hypothetical protein [Fusobacterium perfoetens]